MKCPECGSNRVKPVRNSQFKCISCEHRWSLGFRMDGVALEPMLLKGEEDGRKRDN